MRHRAPSRLPLHTGLRPASPEGFEGLCVMQDTECVSKVTLIHPSNVLTGRGTFQVLAAHQELSKSGCTGACRSKLNPINGESGGGRQVVNGTAAAVISRAAMDDRPHPHWSPTACTVETVAMFLSAGARQALLGVHVRACGGGRGQHFLTYRSRSVPAFKQNDHSNQWRCLVPSTLPGLQSD